jgi:RNA polymerase sigma-70 factor (ECF subfamily)
VFPKPAGERDWGALLAEQIRQNGRLFFCLAFGILRNSAAAEDVVQQAMLRAWERKTELEDDKSIRAWLARFVVTASLQVRRRNKTEEGVLAVEATLTPVHSEPGDAHVEIRESVLLAMEQLPEVTRLVVAMRIMQGMSGNEVKEVLGLSASDVSRHLYRGTEILRNSLADWKHLAE